ncbi:MAG: carboxyltransferase subunit alpha [Eubacteriales bacterium]|nr:carboxyltransferase subunit alpha [Eubacteriales bacterium]
MLSSRKKNTRKAWQQVLTSRDSSRARGMEYIRQLFSEYVLHRGDRAIGEDSSLLCGIGNLNGMIVSFIISNKGEDLNEQIANNFGMCSPEGFHKAIRTMQQAEKFGRPLITIVDTPGAYPGIHAEEQGQSIAIARSLMTMMNLRIPVVTAIVGEGGSGGALGIACGNRVLMFENAIYSVISPEGFASILWKNSKRADEASEILKLTSDHLLDYGIVDEVVAEVPYQNKEEFRQNIVTLKERIYHHLQELIAYSGEELSKQRAKRFQKFGEESWES